MIILMLEIHILVLRGRVVHVGEEKRLEEDWFLNVICWMPREKKLIIYDLCCQ
jgi:hypothetical protein